MTRRRELADSAVEIRRLAAAPRVETRAAITTLGRSSPRLARLRRLIGRDDQGLTVVDGPKLVEDLVRAGLTPLELYLIKDQAALVDELGRLGNPPPRTATFVLDDETARRIAPTSNSQGVLAVFAVKEAAPPCRGVVLYLDRVQDPGNLGAVIRCAAAFGASGVACSPGCADPFSPRAVRGSAGQALLLPVRRDSFLPELSAAALERGGMTVGAEAAGGVALGLLRLRSPLVVILGNEGAGLSPEVRACCDAFVTLPLQRGVESLNVAVTAGVILAALSGLATAPILDVEQSSGGSG